MSARSPLTVARHVQAALDEGRPVVALESTIISHGLPRPRNLEVALELEAMLRAAGVVPATVGVPAGRPTVGLDPEQLETLATATDVVKVGVRGATAGGGGFRHAATTVASSAALARLAGIRVLATGGIGGVHRRASETFDESSDLPTLARTAITVVCAGCEVDPRRAGDPGAPRDARRHRRRVSDATIPGFLRCRLGPRPRLGRFEPDEIAAVMRAADSLGLANAIVVANPVP